MSDSDSDVSMSDATPSAASLGTSLDDVDLNDPTLDFSLPSADELSRLRQTQLMYKSNMFRLQLDELLHESRFFQPDSTGDTQLSRKQQRTQLKQRRQLESALHTFKSLLDSISSSSVVLDAQHVYLGVQCHAQPEVQTLEMQPPAAMNLVGSYLQQTVSPALVKEMVVDVAVQLPESWTQERDHINYRYLDKRAAYLDALGRFLVSASGGAVERTCEVTVEQLHGEALKPVLLLRRGAGARKYEKLNKKKLKKKRKRSGGDDEDSEDDDEEEDLDLDSGAPLLLLPKGFALRVLVTLPAELIPRRKLGPARNSVRAMVNAEHAPIPTPFYNQLVLEDMTMLEHLQLLHSLLSTSQGARDAIVLLKVWLRQRGFHQQAETGLTGFTASVVVAYLLQSRAVNEQFSSYQIFRAAMQFLAHTSRTNGMVSKFELRSKKRKTAKKGKKKKKKQQADTVEDPDETKLPLGFARTPESLEDEARDPTPPRRGDFARAFDVVLVDATGVVNYFHQATFSGFSRVQHEAALTLSMLDDSSRDHFASVFMTRVEMPLSVDYLVHMRGPLGFVDEMVTSAAAPASATDGSGSSLAEGSTLSVVTPRTWPRVEHASYVPPLQPARSAHDRAAMEAHALLERALNTRVQRIFVARTATGNVGERRFDPTASSVLVQSNEEEEAAGITVGLCVDASNYLRDWDIGPESANEAAARQFRRFWGERAELRRFHDITIRECVVWRNGEDDQAGKESRRALTERHGILLDVVRYAAQRHLHVHPLAVQLVGVQLDHITQFHPAGERLLQALHSDPRVRSPLLPLPDHPQHTGAQLKVAFRRTMEMLRQLRDVPLSLTAVQSPDPALRGTAVFPPRPVPYAKIDPLNPAQDITPIEIIATLEPSSQWPDDLLAISRIKTAFYVKIASSFREAHRARTVVAHSHVDLFVNGFVFRLRLHYPPEVLMLKAEAQTKARVKATQMRNAELRLQIKAQKQAAGEDDDDQEVETALREMDLEPPALPPTPPTQLELDYVVRPRLAAVLAGVATAHQSFGPAAALAKRWVASHLLAPVLIEETVEILMASVYLDPQPFDAPRSPLVAFYRFLRLLAQYDWQHAPLIVDLKGEIEDWDGVQRTVRTAFDKARKSPTGGPAMYLATFTPYDIDSCMWTFETPTQADLQRAVALAQSSAAHIRTLLLREQDSAIGEWNTVFRTPMRLYDAFITLRPDMLSGVERALVVPAAWSRRLRLNGEADTDGDVVMGEGDEGDAAPKYKPPPTLVADNANGADKQQDQDDEPKNKNTQRLIGFNAVQQLVRDLEHDLHTVASFAYDPYGGHVVTVTWKRAMFLPRVLNEAEAHYMAPVRQQLLVPNMFEVLTRIRELGEGLIEDVVLSYKDYIQE